MKKPKRITGSAVLLLQRTYLSEPWQLKWPKKVQQASFASLTHDELIRLGLRDQLQNRLGTIRVSLMIKEIGDRDAKDVEEDGSQKCGVLGLPPAACP